MSKHTKTRNIIMDSKINSAKYRAGLSQALELPSNITEDEFIELVNSSPVSQFYALIERSKTHPNLVGLDINRTLINSKGLDTMTDKIFKDLDNTE